ncbi:MAG: hypothetical protein PHV32_16905 [Eubacteriales bacterium]|nr:hypothetical protein [Eubacteriales bacterium]
MVNFDELIANGEHTKAARLFAKEYYDSGKMGHTRKLLIEMLADKCDKYDEAIARQSVKSEEVAEAIGFIQGGYGDVWKWSKKRREIIIAALQAYQPWVSVEDSPKKDNKYLAVLQFYKEPKDRTIEVVEYYGEWKVNYEWNVICYKPLPEPPKGE